MSGTTSSSFVIVPLTTLPSQSCIFVSSGQQIQIDLSQRSTGLYVNFWLNGTQLLAGRICQDRQFLINRPYLGFPGDFMLIDQQGTSDPTYDGLGNRYLLTYWSGTNVG